MHHEARAIMRTKQWSAGFLVISALILACAPRSKYVTLDPYSSASLVAFHDYGLAPDHKDYALHEIGRARVYLDFGDYYDAEASLAAACDVMERITGDESQERAAVVGAEASKVFKGEPYERALAWFYRGLSRYQVGDYPGALAGFRHALASDQETRSRDQGPTEDFVVAHVMAAKTYGHLGELSNAQASLNIARQYVADTTYLTDELLQANLLVLVEAGNGPLVRAGGLLTSKWY